MINNVYCVPICLISDCEWDCYICKGMYLSLFFGLRTVFFDILD